jgi:uncharacterized protein YdeI (YjbR/CyaY-like superfamily)
LLFLALPFQKSNRKWPNSDHEFVKASDWATWLGENHDKEKSVWVIFPKKSTGETSISFEEALDIALAYGWIDISIRKIDERTYGRKFTPRRPDSSWSASNIENVKRLKRKGKIAKRGLEAFERRTKRDS